jgi:hypothetical protein
MVSCSLEQDDDDDDDDDDDGEIRLSERGLVFILQRLVKVQKKLVIIHHCYMVYRENVKELV